MYIIYIYIYTCIYLHMQDRRNSCGNDVKVQHWHLIPNQPTTIMLTGIRASTGAF